MLKTLDVKGGYTILWMKEVLLSGVLLLEDKKCCKHSKNYAPCHLPIEDTVHPKLAVVERIFHVLCVGRRKEQLPLSYVTSVNVVGTWHA